MYIGFTSSGTALILVNPRRKTTYTLLAPHLSAEVAQSNAVSPAPSTITFPFKLGRLGAEQPPHKPSLLPADAKGKKVLDV